MLCSQDYAQQRPRTCAHRSLSSEANLRKRRRSGKHRTRLGTSLRRREKVIAGTSDQDRPVLAKNPDHSRDAVQRCQPGKAKAAEEAARGEQRQKRHTLRCM